MSVEFYWIAVAAVTVLSVARLTRLAVIDKFPPIKYLRDAYENATDGSGWQWLALCGYCAAPYFSALVVLLGWWAGVYDADARVGLTNWMLAWWIVNSILAVSYVGAIVMAFDGDTNEDY